MWVDKVEANQKFSSPGALESYGLDWENAITTQILYANLDIYCGSAHQLQTWCKRAKYHDIPPRTLRQATMSPAAMSSPQQTAFHQDTSNDSLPSAMSLGQHNQMASSMDPRGSFRQQQQQPRNSPGPVRKPMPVPVLPAHNGRVAGSSNFSSGPPPPPPPVAVQQPMGLPRQAGKLVPGRMSSGRENQTQSRDETATNFCSFGAKE